MKPYVDHFGRLCVIRSFTESVWVKGNQSSHLVRIWTVDEETGKESLLFRINGYQPFPVKGWFESSYRFLSAWYIQAGWERKEVQEVFYQ